MGLLVLPPADVGGLKAIKSFYNLSRRREAILASPPNIREGIWFLCGFPNELTSEEPPEAGYEIVKGFRSTCGAGGIRHEYQTGDYDYLEFEVRYGGISEAPERFRGCSGGGLWQVPLIRSEDGAFTPEKYILSGVIFYEHEVVDNCRLIKCHGRQSIYRAVIDAINQNVPQRAADDKE